MSSAAMLWIVQSRPCKTRAGYPREWCPLLTIRPGWTRLVAEIHLRQYVQQRSRRLSARMQARQREYRIVPYIQQNAFGNL